MFLRAGTAAAVVTFAFSLFVVTPSFAANAGSTAVPTSAAEATVNSLPVVVSGPVGTGELDATLPAGAQPTTLVTTAELSPGVTGGSITFTPNGALPDTISVSSLHVSGLTTVSIPLAGAQVTNGFLGVNVRVSLNSQSAAECFPNGSGPALTFTSGKIEFTDDAAPPTTVADYFPATLRRADVWVPSQPSADEEQAALQAVAALANLYPQAIVSIEALPVGQSLPPAKPFDEWDRDIVIKSGGSSSSVVGPAGSAPDLLISGHGVSLADEVRALSTPQFALASASDVGRIAVKAPPFGGTSSLSLAQLGESASSMSGVGQLQISVPVAQASFGGPIRSATVEVDGIHTPVADGALANISLLWNNTMLSSTQLGAGDTYHAKVSVPVGLLERSNQLIIRADYTPAGGRCAVGVAPFEFDLASSSSVSVLPGQTLDDGFQRFPQAFSNRVPVALATPGINALQDAGTLLASMQRLNGAVLQVSLTTLRSVEASTKSALVVGADPTEAAQLGAPLQFEPFRTIAADNVQVGVTVNQPFAALEGFDSHGRELLLLGSFGQTPALQQSVVQAVARATGGWYGLDGDVLMVSAAGKTLMLPTNSIVPQPALVHSGRSLPGWAKVLIGLAVVAFLGRVAWVWIRRARLRAAVRRATRVAEAEVEHADVD